MIVRKTEAGQTWAELASLDPLAAVIDPADTRGGKNRLIDRVHKRALRYASGDLRGLRVLDFGCGTGRLSSWLIRHGAVVDGVDVTPEMIRVASKLVAGGRFHVVGGTALPFEDASFDLVVTAYVLQYYLEDAAVVRELSRVLDIRGRIIAIEQVTGADLGRGGTAAAYERLLGEAGLAKIEASPIRMGDSYFLALAHRMPLLSRLPALPWLLMLEARARADKARRGDDYVDTLFEGVKTA